MLVKMCHRRRMKFHIHPVGAHNGLLTNRQERKLLPSSHACDMHGLTAFLIEIADEISSSKVCSQTFLLYVAENLGRRLATTVSE